MVDMTSQADDQAAGTIAASGDAQHCLCAFAMYDILNLIPDKKGE